MVESCLWSLLGSELTRRWVWTSQIGSEGQHPSVSAWLLGSHLSASLVERGMLGGGVGRADGAPSVQKDVWAAISSHFPQGRLCQYSPCSSLLAAARRVEEVLAASVLGVPGRLVPLELPPDGLRSLLGGVFFFCKDWGVSLKAQTATPIPSHPIPGICLTAMKSAEEVSLSMSLSSELSD